MIEPLNVRELQILRRAANGLTYQQTADELKLKAETVRKYAVVMLERMDARNIAHAVAIGLREGIIT